jgi:hypothetical protein
MLADIAINNAINIFIKLIDYAGRHSVRGRCPTLISCRYKLDPRHDLRHDIYLDQTQIGIIILLFKWVAIGSRFQAAGKVTFVKRNLVPILLNVLPINFEELFIYELDKKH